jgi:hypothetical protein
MRMRVKVWEIIDGTFDPKDDLLPAEYFPS